MKRTLTALALILALALPAIAKQVQTATIKLPTLQCGSCKKTIEKKLKGFTGLDSVNVDVEAKTATVVYDAEVTTVGKLEQAISKIGYDANDVHADKVAQKKLPACCQPGGEE